MRIDGTGMFRNPINSQNTEKNIHTDSFYRMVQNQFHTSKASKDEYVPSAGKTFYYCSPYDDIYKVNRQILNIDNVQTVETDKYLIEADGTNLLIYDKEFDEVFRWITRWESGDAVKVDQSTGKKFLINNMGSGLFEMIAVDEELEAALKEAFGVDELKEKPLEGFTVQQDQKTGIYYVTAYDYEWQGGQIILDKEAREKLDALAKEYLEEYPNLMRSYNEAWFYASFEVRGLVRRTGDGILMLHGDHLTFLDKDGESRWSMFIDEITWEMLKEAFDQCPEEELGKEEYWKKLFGVLGLQNIQINYN